jgi:hypothetical protein
MLVGRRGRPPKLNVVCLVGKSLNHPGSRGARRPVGAINRLQIIEAASPIGKIKTLQAPGGEIIANDRFGHIAPADARQQQGMLGAQVRQTPRLGPEHTKIVACRERRAVGEHQLRMVPCRSGLVHGTERQRVAWRRYRYQLHTADTGPLKSWNAAVARLADTNMGNAGMDELGHRAK